MIETRAITVLEFLYIRTHMVISEMKGSALCDVLRHQTRIHTRIQLLGASFVCNAMSERRGEDLLGLLSSPPDYN